MRQRPEHHEQSGSGEQDLDGGKEPIDVVQPESRALEHEAVQQRHDHPCAVVGVETVRNRPGGRHTVRHLLGGGLRTRGCCATTGPTGSWPAASVPSSNTSRHRTELSDRSTPAQHRAHLACLDCGLVECRPVDELLNGVVERANAEQLEVEIRRALEDPVHAGVPADDGEDRDLDVVDEAGGH